MHVRWLPQGLQVPCDTLFPAHRGTEGTVRQNLCASNELQTFHLHLTEEGA